MATGILVFAIPSLVLLIAASAAQRQLLAVVGSVLRGEIRPFFGKIIQRKDGRHGAHRDAGAAIDALLRFDVEHFRVTEVRFVLFRVDAVHRAGVDTSGVFCSNAGFSDYVGHRSVVRRNSILPWRPAETSLAQEVDGGFSAKVGQPRDAVIAAKE